ncbi:MAG: transcription-repair coupling factor [Bacteroidia bacterium]|nr:transcription-repair coupling factor [Bacteroidia bacterium]
MNNYLIETYLHCIRQKFTTDSKYRFYIENAKASYPSFVLLSLLNNINVLYILCDEEQALASFNEISSFLPQNTFFFPALHLKNGEKHKYYDFNLQQRTSVQEKLVSKEKNNIIITYYDAITEPVCNKQAFEKNQFLLHLNENISYNFLLEFLREYNFLKNEFVYFPGQYSVRGNIIDIYSYSNEYPVRIELKNNTIFRLSEFHPSSQMSFRNIDKTSISPKLELEKDNTSSILSYFDDNDMIALKDSKTFQYKFEDTSVMRIPKEKIFEDIVKKKILEFGVCDHLSEKNILSNISTQLSFGKNYDALVKHLHQQYQKGYKCIFVSNNANQYKRLLQIIEDILSNEHITEDNAKIIEHLNASINEGFTDHDCKVDFYTEHQLFGKYHPIKRRDKAEETNVSLTIKDLIQLKPGDYVVHIDHGIGRFAGLHTIEINGKKQEVIKLLYKNNDTLFVNIHNLYRLSKYSGKDGHEPRIDQLGSQRWQNLKQKIKSSVKELAYDLIKLYAERKASEGFAFSKDTYLQHELEASFPYEDTPDQLKVTREVKRDMEKSYPMDRLVCGDVGFGKTEIAIRAAFKAVTDNKQVAVLVPTTILALQHYRTFSERLKNFPVHIDYLNRFRSSKEQKEIFQKLKEGKIDIIIGTHKLLSKEVQFKDLGLLIIDEEHKFGVADKDKIKLIKKNVDTLTLTATPIPRTLQFSLIGARDLSVIQTPPPNRYPVKTELHAFSDEIIQQAILKETERGGQVFFVHNRVQDIFELAHHIQSLVPQIKISVAHGQMKSHELEDAVFNFVNGYAQVLISTNIIESGIDISNANTIIINNAQNFGLSDLHQLRGRVGRSNRQAYCYLLVPSLNILTDDAKKRLKVILEFSDLGSGFQIAMKDLDIRGAGNLLGAEQSGFINEIGIDTYMKILNEALSEIKASEDTSHEKVGAFSHQLNADTVIDTDLPLFIPSDYIDNSNERLNIYKQLNSCNTYQQLEEFTTMLKDRFGDIPKETIELIESVKLRWQASKLGFEKIILKGGKMIAIFLSNPEHVFYKSDVFSKIMSYISSQKNFCNVKEQNNKLMLIFENVKEIKHAQIIIQNIYHAIHEKSSNTV